MIEHHSFPIDSAPTFAILLVLERRAPVLITNAVSGEREARLRDWIDSQPALRDLRDHALAARSATEGGNDL